MPRFGICALAALAALALAGCAPPRGAALSTEILRGSEEADAAYAVVPVTRANLSQLRGWPAAGGVARAGWPAASTGPATPVIRAGDLVSLVIWDSQANSLLTAESEKAVRLADLVVTPQGDIFVPYLDKVSVAGRTPDDARRAIQEALEPIVPSAQVQLSVAAGRMNSVDLVSGVARPGSFALPDRNFTILSLIAQGGGIDPALRNPVVRLLRDGKRHEISAERLMADPARNIALRGGDKVVVEPDRRSFTALGATGRQSLVTFEKDEITAIETLALTGGLEASRADPKGVLILRDYPASAVRGDGRGPARRQVVFTFDLTTADGLFAARAFRVQPGDTVLVTEAPLVSTRNVLGLIGAALGAANTASAI